MSGALSVYRTPTSGLDGTILGSAAVISRVCQLRRRTMPPGEYATRRPAIADAQCRKRRNGLRDSPELRL